MTKYLFVCVHPDDLEFNCANLMHYLVKQGKEVHILSLTKGEFGIFEESWKGPRLGEIRIRELEKAAEVNGIPANRVHFGDIVDGFVRFTRENVNGVMKWLDVVQPDVVFAPEAYFTYYWHPDHINCGRLLYYIARWKNSTLKHPLRSLYFYTSSKANFIWPFQDVKHGGKALYQHQSQWWILKWNKVFYPLEKRNFRKRQIGSWKYTERYRRISLLGKEPKAGILARGLLGLISGLNVINPPDSHFKVPDTLSEFGQKVAHLRDKYKFKD